jgi:hypothetical protein
VRTKIAAVTQGVMADTLNRAGLWKPIGKRWLSASMHAVSRMVMTALAKPNTSVFQTGRPTSASTEIV